MMLPAVVSFIAVFVARADVMEQLPPEDAIHMLQRRAVMKSTVECDGGDCELRSSKPRLEVSTHAERLRQKSAFNITEIILKSNKVVHKASVASPTAAPMEFYFGDSLPSSAASGAVLDAGTGYGTSSTSAGQSYGWDCDGDSSGINYAGGIRNTGRGGGLGLNHFDRSNTCKHGSTYKPVNWQLEVPNGQYDVQVVFAESYKSGCAVEGVNAGCGNSYCDVSKTVAITDGKFTVTGYGHDSGLCHSLSKVAIQQASSSLLLTQRTKPSTLNDTGKILHHKDAVLSKTVEAHKINEHEPVYTGEEGTRKRFEVEQLKHKMKEETEDTEDNKRDLKDLEEGLKAIQDEITQKTHQKQ